MPLISRYIYAGMFLVVNVLAWFLRDYGFVIVTNIERAKGRPNYPFNVTNEGLTRVSLGCFIFYLIMCVSTLGTTKLHQQRATWHSSWWVVKGIMILVLLAIPFFLPPLVLSIYGYASYIGAGVFLLIQLISMISFITWINDKCDPEENNVPCHRYVMLLTITLHILWLVGIVMLYIWNTSRFNLFFITFTLVLHLLMTIVSCHPRVNVGILTPGLMGLYGVYLCWSAIDSEPQEVKYNRKSGELPNIDWMTILSFVIAVLVMVFETYTTGIDSKCFQFMKDDDDDDVPYSYGFFHLVFATGQMYFTMLLIGWSSHHSMDRWKMDVGWASTWVKIATSWLIVCIYFCMVVGPIVWRWNTRKPDESQEHGNLIQEDGTREPEPAVATSVDNAMEPSLEGDILIEVKDEITAIEEVIGSVISHCEVQGIFLSDEEDVEDNSFRQSRICVPSESLEDVNEVK